MLPAVISNFLVFLVIFPLVPKLLICELYSCFSELIEKSKTWNLITFLVGHTRKTHRFTNTYNTLESMIVRQKELTKSPSFFY